MSKSNAFETDINELIFLSTALADLAENDSSSPATTLTFALHTSSPGEAGNQTTNEATYTSYARQTVSRSGSGFTVSGATVDLDANLDFPEATGGSETITHFSIGTGVSNYMMYYGTVTPNISVSSGVIPRLNSGTILTED